MKLDALESAILEIMGKRVIDYALIKLVIDANKCKIIKNLLVFYCYFKNLLKFNLFVMGCFILTLFNDMK